MSCAPHQITGCRTTLSGSPFLGQTFKFFSHPYKGGSFPIGLCWYVLCLSKGGERDRATHLFEKLLSYSNHLRLFFEELDTDGKQLGNYPQAFTHLALISAAIELSKKETLVKKVVPPDGVPKMV